MGLRGQSGLSHVDLSEREGDLVERETINDLGELVRNLLGECNPF